MDRPVGIDIEEIQFDEGLKNNMKKTLFEAGKVTFTTGINRPAGYVYSTATWKNI